MPDLPDQILSLVARKNYVPLKPKALARKLNVSSASYPDFRRALRELIDYFEVTDFLNVTQFAGYLSHEQVTRSMRLFADRVMPHFRPGARNGGG